MAHCRSIQASQPKQFLVFLKKSQKIFQDENITLSGDFNMTLEDKNVNFTETFSFEHLINESNSLKGSPSCIDLIMTYRKSYLKNACVTVTGISNFSLKSQILKALSKTKTYRNQNNI